MSSAPGLKALQWPFKNPSAIFLTDFDGTITIQDSNDFMTDTIGFGLEKRRQGNREILEGTDTFRDGFRKMLDSVTRPFPKCVEYLVQHIELDPRFNDFYQWALKNEIPTVVVSSGMSPIIRAILKNLVGPDADKIDVIANEAETRPGKSFEDEGGWQIKFRDESGFGHDKSRTLRPYRSLPSNQRPIIFYAGDGVSDLSAAREADLLFAKKGRDLISYCVRENIPFTVFEDWSDILEKVQDITSGKISVQAAAKEGYEAYKRGEAGVKTS